MIHYELMDADISLIKKDPGDLAVTARLYFTCAVIVCILGPKYRVSEKNAVERSQRDS